MGSDLQNVFFTLMIVGASITAFVLFVIYIAVPLFKGVGTGVGWFFRGVGWFFTHIFEFVFGMCRDLIRFVGALIAMIVLIPMVPLNIVIGRWSAAGHFAEGVKRETQVGAACVYRAVIRRPLKLLLLDGLLEGLEQRVPEAMQAAPAADKPGRRVGQFDGYTILGSLRAGGSGAKLYVAEPDANRRKIRGMRDRVVIKSFALSDGSSLPQIVRESRALECAKQLGLVLDHGMDEHRFFYVMPYHAGEHLGILTRQMHGESSGRGLDHKRLNLAMSYMRDLLTTLSAYHKGGLWHKDVKPENIIVHDGTAHLVDLGLVTPLRSAMTLTTHGTEYFRDPEMVRQALRGVKVHQIDGGKFDVYAAGAVLYFMIENTFPAHGGLSRFVVAAPESLRWIVRRAMTDYNQRYDSADQMLADLSHVMEAREPFAVKPADLPSMRGEQTLASVDAEGVEVVAAAGNPFPSGGAQAHHRKVESPANADGAAAASGSQARQRPRPKITVTNWWTGAYRVDSSAAMEAASGSGDSGSNVETISRQAVAGMLSARRAAREQIKSARARAKQLRDRAVARRHKMGYERARTPVSTIIIAALSIMFLGAILFAAFRVNSPSSSPSIHAANGAASDQGRPLIIAVDNAGPLNDSLRNQIKRLVREYRDGGYDVIEDAGESLPAVLPSIREWRANRSSESDSAIEGFLAEKNAYGLLHVTVSKSKKSGRLLMQDPFLIRSSRSGAEQRRRLPEPIIPIGPSQPYLLINDHPTKADVAIAAEIERQLKAYRERGWMLVSNNDLEVKVRNVLPVGPVDPKISLSPVLHATLAAAEFGGIMRIDGTAGPGSPRERVTLTRIERDPSIPAPTSGAPAIEDSAPDQAKPAASPG